MTSDDFRRSGVVLAKRVRSVVDSRASLDRLYRRHRRRRVAIRLALAAAVVAGIAAPAILVRLSAPTENTPVGTVTTQPITAVTPTTGSTSLPLTIHAALLDDYSIEGAEGTCTGTAGHASMQVGASVAVIDDATGGEPRVIAEAVISNTGTVVDAVRVRALGLPSTESACLFDLATITAEPENVGSLVIAGRFWPPTDRFESGTTRAGRQIVFYSRGVRP